jgi:drug/metabolite transporter (DMT)-like permease
MRFSLLARRPGVTVLVGAVAIAFSGILFRLSHVSASTGAFYRCVWALPLLWLIARWEERRWGPRPARSRYFAWGAGALFAADLVLWHNAIEQVGAGLATVLGNIQVVWSACWPGLCSASGRTERRSLRFRSSQSGSC